MLREEGSRGIRRGELGGAHHGKVGATPMKGKVMDMMTRRDLDEMDV